MDEMYEGISCTLKHTTCEKSVYKMKYREQYIVTCRSVCVHMCVCIYACMYVWVHACFMANQIYGNNNNNI